LSLPGLLSTYDLRVSWMGWSKVVGRPLPTPGRMVVQKSASRIGIHIYTDGTFRSDSALD
jgi:hypothetical protein